MKYLMNTSLLVLFTLIWISTIVSQGADTRGMSSEPSPTSSSSQSANSNDSKVTKTDSPDSSTPTKSGSSSNSSSSSKSSSKIPLNAARGMVTFIEPPVAQNFIAGWAIGSVANLKWKYDKNLLVKPNNISIIAMRQESANIIIYNIGLELPGDTTEFQWDTANFTSDPTNPPLVESDTYYMYIYDTARPYTSGAPAGGLNPFKRQFRLYKSTNGGSNICLKCLSNSSKLKSSPATTFLLLSLLASISFLPL